MRNHMVPKKDTEKDESDKNSKRLRETELWLPRSFTTLSSKFLFIR